MNLSFLNYQIDQILYLIVPISLISSIIIENKHYHIHFTNFIIIFIIIHCQDYLI